MQETIPKLVTITESAAKKVRQYMTKENEHYLGVRVSVESSSCSCCTSYGLTLEKSLSDSDVVVEDKELKIIVGKADVEVLRGSEIDYVESLQRTGFRVNNPNNAESCGCG